MNAVAVNYNILAYQAQLDFKKDLLFASIGKIQTSRLSILSTFADDRDG